MKSVKMVKKSKHDGNFFFDKKVDLVADSEKLFGQLL